jgi:class 3 adenylate cyclase
MGLHTGEPTLTASGYVGLDVHRAARICAAGHGGQTILSQTMHALVEHGLPAGARLQDLGIHRLKDLQRPEP